MAHRKRRSHRKGGNKRRSFRRLAKNKRVVPRTAKEFYAKGQRRKHQGPDGRRNVRRRARIQRNGGRPQTAKQFWAMSKHDRDEWEKITSVVSEGRATGKSPRKIAKRLGIDFKTVLRKSGRVIHKQPNGRYVVRPTDKLLRILLIPTKKGMREVATRDSRQATLVAEYWIAVHRYIDPETHAASALRKFEGKYVTDSNGRKVPLLTDLSKLDQLASAGVLSFETIYAKR